MGSTVDIPFERMLLLYALMLIPLGLFYREQLGLIKETCVALLRMTAQLLLVGFYLFYVFHWNSIFYTSLWVAIMLLSANLAILKKSGLRRQVFFKSTMMSIALSTCGVSFFALFVVIQPSPPYDARYIIPIVGMLLGNTLRSNIVSLERFYSSVRDHRDTHLVKLMLGAELSEAVAVHFKEALRAAIRPTLATMATVGVVSLPGMMTGQILGGGEPLIAAKYQIAIMIQIFVVMVLSSYLNIRMSLKNAFDEYGNLKEEIWLE
ncbi:MAG: ABC transporter permease [Planctomycetes bacterium]|nr:ABC transporter permease [Planctomycetota bacterium]